MADPSLPETVAAISPVKVVAAAVWKNLEGFSQKILSISSSAPDIHSAAGERAKAFVADAIVVLALTLIPALILAAFALSGVIEMGAVTVVLIFALLLGSLFVSWFPIPLKHRGIIIILYVVMVAGTWEYINSHYVRPLTPDELAKRIADDLVNGKPNPKYLQQQELIELSKFLDGDESTLRDKFDIPGLVATNIYVQNMRIAWYADGNTGQYPYFGVRDMKVKDGHWNANNGPNFIGRTAGPSGVGIVETPKDVLFLSGTSAYLKAITQLDAFIRSPLVPENIRVPLRGVRAALVQDETSLLDTLDEMKAQDDRYFTQAGDDTTMFGSAIANKFYSKFHAIEPDASTAVKLIQSKLNTG